MAKCVGCDGHGSVLLNQSWFLTDGFRKERCGACDGTGINPDGYRDWGGMLAFQRRNRKLIAEWGGLRPPHQQGRQ